MRRRDRMSIFLALNTHANAMLSTMSFLFTLHSSFGGHARHTQSIASLRIVYSILCMFRLRYESHQHHLNARRMHAVGVRSW